MRFRKIWSTTASGAGLAPKYERFGPIERDTMTQADQDLIDQILSSQNFSQMSTSPITKAVRDMALSSLTVEFENGETNTVRFMPGEMNEELEQLVKTIRRMALES